MAMEMENPALQHTMDIQTQLMQQIIKMQQQQEMDRMKDNSSQVVAPPSNPAAAASGSFGTPLPPNIASPTSMPTDDEAGYMEPIPIASTDIPVSVPDVKSSIAEAPSTEKMALPSSDMVAQPPSDAKAEPLDPKALPLFDPTKYDSYASDSVFGGRQAEATSPFAPATGFISGTIREMRDFDATKHSKEATSAFFEDQSRDIQEKAVGVTAGAMTGATAAASLFIPGGIIPALAIGAAASFGVKGVSDTFVGEAKEALNYQEILQNTDHKFINAFESTNELGGIGMGLKDRQEISRYLRELAPEEYLDEGEMSQILEGAANNNLLKSVSDVKSFKEKFSEIVGAVKEITVTMNQTIEEATAFMGEMEARGISTKDMPFIAAQTRVMGSMLGMDPTQASNLLLGQVDQITQGTSLNATDIAQSSSKTLAIAQQVQDDAKEAGDPIYNYSKNLGGPQQAGAEFDLTARKFAETEFGQTSLLGFYAPAFDLNEETGEFELNQEKMDMLVSGDFSADEMEKASRQYVNSLSEVEKLKLSDTISARFSEGSSQEDLAEFADRTAKLVQERAAEGGNDIDYKQALQQIGFAKDPEQAAYFEQMLQASTDDSFTKMYESKVLKEEQDANAISNSPGFFKQMKFGWERTFGNYFGDKAQDITDATGQVMMDYQKFVTGVDDRSMVGGAPLNDFTYEGVDQMAEDLAVINQNNEAINDYEKERGADEIKQGKGFRGTARVAKATVTPDEVADSEKQVKKMAKERDEIEEVNTGRYRRDLARIREGEMPAAEVAAMKKKQEKGEYGIVEGMRADVIENKAQGEYEGFWGTVDYGLDRFNVGFASSLKTGWDWSSEKATDWLGEPKDEKAKTLSAETLEEQRDKMIKDKQTFKKETTKLLTSNDKDIKGLSEKELEKLEAAIESGSKKKVKAITDNETALEIAGKYADLKDTDEKLAKNAEVYKNYSRQTKGMATAPTQIADLLAASDVMGEAEINDLLGDARKEGKKTNKQLKKGKLNVLDMLDANNRMAGEIDAALDGLSKKEMTEFAKYLDSKDSQVTFKDFTDKSGDINDEKLKDYVLKTVQAQHVSNPDGKDKPGKKASSKEIKETAKEHEESMAAFLSMMQSERQMMEDAINGMPVNGSNSTSVSTKRSN
ncbi:hypothetical protein ACQKJG_18990 [Priestia megaterium]|uniref:hypothetical protein n=1 Tax=Priestia megaterium TaxID=1404 RepID=UPI003D02CE26